MDKDLESEEIAKRESKSEIEKRLDNLEELDKESEKKKRKLRRKVRVRNSIILVLIIIIIILLLRGCGSGVGIRFAPLLQGDGDKMVSHDTESLYVTMPVVEDFSVSSKNPTITLYSPEQNKDLFYIYYTFTNEDGEVIYQSDAVEAGKKFKVNFKDLLSEGEHKVHVHISSKFMDSLEDANGVTSDIAITVQK